MTSSVRPTPPERTGALLVSPDHRLRSSLESRSATARRFDWWVASSVEGALEALDSAYLSLVVIDFRPRPHRARELGLAVLERLDETDDPASRYGFHRIVALLGEGRDEDDSLLITLGARGVRHVLRVGPNGGARRAADAIAEYATTLVSDRERGKRALCAAGGGITGIYFELGALKCLDDCLSDDAVNTFDMFFGISAGAVVTGLISAGYSVDEIMAAICGFEGGRVPPIDLRLFRFSHLDRAELGKRLREGARAALQLLVRALPFGGKLYLEDVLFQYGDILAPPFRADRFGDVLSTLLDRPGATNDFRRLPRPLFVGASDQDRRRHALFGTEELDHVEISRAIQASLSVNPAFNAVPIEGRFYEDGAVTRTTNFVEAIRRGADLLVLLDPFVPFVSKAPGFSSARGLLYNVDQNLRTLSYTRFENTLRFVLAAHPEVSAYSFLPSNRTRRVLSVSPMDHRPYYEVWRGAYLSTFQRLEQIGHRLKGDLATHGIALSMERASEVAARLKATERPDFADFFPDRRVRLSRPPLCLERGR